MKVTHEMLVGKTQDHLIPWDKDPNILFHKEMKNDFEQLCLDAKDAGFDLCICSGFRSFDRQLKIWNEKATGKRQLLDTYGSPLSFSGLSEMEILYSILRWSALPGGSRHHWGSDLDIYDANSLPENYQIQLTPEEVSDDGMFGPFHNWLDEKIKNSEAYGFYRPFKVDRGGVATERWHLSYSPIADVYSQKLTLKTLSKTIQETEIELKDLILDQLSTIYDKFIINTCSSNDQ